MKRLALSALALFVVASAACKDPASSNDAATTSVVTPASAGVTGQPAPAGESVVAPGAKAEVGKPAPDFTLKDVDGKEVKLSSFKGKKVVLEWFNPGCPFVQAAHSKGSLKDAAKRHTANGVVWLAINSGAPGRQGHGAAANKEAAKSWSLDHPILLDESGAVGRAYGATNTPHMMVIDDKGTLVYRGAVDNSPDGEGDSPAGGKLVSYVDGALADLGAARPVGTAETKAYGCSVKYAK
ncbi:MAG: redoxin family protein [Deltaproteobacteria bacterium]|nr:redoxin family protein [Deltaproteobacteria bacterium]